MIRINDIIDKIQEYNPSEDINLVEQAYIYSARVHEGQVRLSGEPYLSHPLEVAGILADMNLDVTSIVAALLHDVIEDTKATDEEIKALFGPKVHHIVAGVTKLGKISSLSSKERQAENIRKMILAMADDIRVIFIKLADRLHNMRTLQYHKNPEKQKSIAQETMDIYAPISTRLGIYWIKQELEDISFRYVYPEEFQQIEELVKKDIKQREIYIDTIKSYIKEKMAEHHLTCEIQGRYKQNWSVYQKMVNQNLEFDEIYDLVAFRIILDSKTKCYEALGVVHNLMKPIAKKFKDYISIPKPNMYQSLHTTVIGPYGEPIEIQIRTWDMDKVAKSGIAAHWSYKEGRRIDDTMSKTYAWLQDMIENYEAIKDPNEFLESVRIDLFPDEVYVFTPDGEIKTLPRGATPVDFAYLIHSQVGNHCSGAKVSGRMVPLNTELKTGDIVQVITSKRHRPSKDWLSFVKTVKARTRIRQWIKKQEKERSLTQGKEILEKAFRKNRLNFNVLLKSETINTVVKHFGFKSSEELIASVGYGKISPRQVLRQFSKPEQGEAHHDTVLDKILSRTPKKKVKGGIIVHGVDDILIRFGKCCRPVPGEEIIGYITRGYGVTVHRKNCANIRKASPERKIDVAWNENVKEYYPVKIRVRSSDRVGLLADIASNISKNGANIVDVHTSHRTRNMVENHFTVSVENTEHLNTVISAVKKVHQVHEVRRIKG
jgi:GTP pyrophosphokinase